MSSCYTVLYDGVQCCTMLCYVMLDVVPWYAISHCTLCQHFTNTVSASVCGWNMCVYIYAYANM